MSSYNSPLPVGSPEGTGAAAIAIAETPGGTNNNGNATDSAGNVKVDFVWGNYPMQPNDVRTDGTPVATVAANASQNYNWNGYSEYPSARLDAALDNHAVAEAEWNNYPSFTPGVGNYMVTAASGNGASTIVARDASGNFTANAITATNFIGGGASISAINGSNVTTGTVANARTTAATANGASTIVLRGASGEFSAGAITSVSISGNGVALTAINASNIASGTVATARLATGTANSSTYLRGDQTWATITAGVTITNDTSTNASYYPVFTTATSGTISAANVSSTELIFNPGLNTLTAPILSASSGFVINNRTIATSYSIPAGYSAMSTGPVTLANGVSVTVASGSRWVVL